jgi:hypothetical protein
MKLYSYFIISIFLFFSACSGVDSRVKKSYKNSETTITLKDLTSSGQEMIYAGSQLEDALENTISRSIFIITQDNAKYVLKYKVLNYKKGSRLARFSTFGIAKSAHAKLEVKAALYDDGEKVGAWTIDAWVKGGPLGGTSGRLFQQAADEIMNHLRGDGDS